MKNGQRLSVGLAVTGVGLVSLVFAATTLAPLRGTIPEDVGWLEYLAVAAMDLFPLVLLGGGLLLWAALRSRSHRRAVGWALVAPVASLAVGIIWNLAVPNTGWSWTLTLLVALYWVGVVAVGVSGVSLARALVTEGRQPSA